jgi:hypothetical protein
VLRPQAGQGLEAAAAEFALLAQRRTRLTRQIDLLDRQRHAAGAAFAQLDARMSILGRRLARLDPSFDQAPGLPALPPPMPPPPPPPPPTPVRTVVRPASRLAPRPQPKPVAAPRRRGVTLEY